MGKQFVKLLFLIYLLHLFVAIFLRFFLGLEKQIAIEAIGLFLLDFIGSVHSITHLIVSIHVSLLVLLYLISVVVKPDLIPFSVIFLVGLVNLLHDSSSFINQFSISLRISDYFKSFLVEAAMST